MSTDLLLYTEKWDQVRALLEELDLEVLLVFGRETARMADPTMRLVVPFDLTWDSALLAWRDGSRTAIVGRYDVPTVEATGFFSSVQGYDAGIGELLRSALAQRDPQRIAINYEGVTHGMYLLLQELLAETPYGARIVPAYELVSRLSAQRTPSEQALLVGALEAAGAIFERAVEFIRVGVTEQEIAAVMHQEAQRWGLATAWPSTMCPIVNTGPHSPLGHVSPTTLRVEPGHLVHVDFGVIRDGYCSDQQRMWYVLGEGETGPPPQVQHAWTTVRTALEAAFAYIRPGLQGWEVDEVARDVFRDAGFPEYQHALGHGVGRSVHDDGPLIGPRWERYGRAPYGVLQQEMVFTLECGISTGHGYLGLEEEVVVEDTGARWLSPPQTELRLVKP